jgi:hypothetical protein
MWGKEFRLRVPEKSWMLTEFQARVCKIFRSSVSKKYYIKTRILVLPGKYETG